MTSERIRIVDMGVDHTSYERAATRITAWAQEGASKYVCIATVNNVMESYDSPEFRSVMNGADLVTPDGMPLVWGLRLLGHKTATRVYGPDLTPVVLEMAASSGILVGFYGGSAHTLRRLQAHICKRFPTLQVVYSYSPPFRPLTPEEDQQVTDDINRSGAQIIFVGLNTPKQDFWMAAHKGRLRAVMLGVGAAFDFLAGTKRQAPRWMMRLGLEWLFRLMTEPRRLWKRYLKHNPRFVILFAAQLFRERLQKAGS